MCGIAGSFSGEKLVELYRLNALRGNGRWTMCSISDDYHIVDLICGSSPAHDDEIRAIAANNKSLYMILHVQAQTTSDSQYHPAISGNISLWHNGIIKEKSIASLQTQLGTSTGWDTMLMAKRFNDDNEYSWLNSVDGSFACVKLDKGVCLSIFRNEICPLFVDDDLNISSTRSSGTKSLAPNAVFSLNLPEKILQCTGDVFKTFDMPYFIPGEKN